MPIVEVTDLTKTFSKLEAVKGVSFNIHEGEVFGFLGPNGAGKTTTISMLCTLIRPTSGSAKLNGYDVILDKNAVRRSIGLVFQDTTLDDHLTAEQNIMFHAFAYGVPRRTRISKTEELLTMLGLWDRKNDKISTYSGGMKRRLEIARGLVHLPEILFLDEPTLGLDPQTRNNIWKYVLKLRDEQSLTIFLTTHHMDEAEYSDRISIIDEGRIVAIDSPNSLKRRVDGDIVTIKSNEVGRIMDRLQNVFSLIPRLEGDNVVVQVTDGESFIPDFLRSYEGLIDSVSLSRPTLEDAFLDLTGRTIRDES